MKQNTDILDKLRNTNGGMTVPEGYFAEFTRRMAASLPERPELEHPREQAALERAQRSLWQRVRPYAYMAAMFAGIWLMLQVFTLVSNPGRLSPMDSNPVMAEALGNDDFIVDYFINEAGLDQWDIIDEMDADGSLSELDFSGLSDPSEAWADDYEIYSSDVNE
ncbi:MAG: hypothetical protein K2L96_04040 [Muribaculaceae bacterium]|nr:hypothetical protein [Muribaculaceae bacterium]